MKKITIVKYLSINLIIIATLPILMVLYTLGATLDAGNIRDFFFFFSGIFSYIVLIFSNTNFIIEHKFLLVGTVTYTILFFALHRMIFNKLYIKTGYLVSLLLSIVNLFFGMWMLTTIYT